MWPMTVRCMLSRSPVARLHHSYLPLVNVWHITGIAHVGLYLCAGKLVLSDNESNLRSLMERGVSSTVATTMITASGYVEYTARRDV